MVGRSIYENYLLPGFSGERTLLIELLNGMHQAVAIRCVHCSILAATVPRLPWIPSSSPRKFSLI